MFVLRIVYAFHFRFDIDEPQHLHVIWGWANGHWQYRDVFDNHGPIFHLLCVPLYRLFGERPDILIPMRLAMIPLFGVCLWCVYRIGTALFSSDVGLWSAALTGFYPEFFLTSTEFRTDVLWTVFWLLALVVATRSPFKARHAFVMGLLLGAAFGVTVKTGLMIGSLVSAAAVIIGWEWLGGKKRTWRSLWTRAIAGLCGLAIIPGVLILIFVALGMGKRFFYCNVSHNLVPHSQEWARIDLHFLMFPIFVAVVLGAIPFVKNRTFSVIAVRGIWLALVAGFYFTALKTLFPTLSRQDDLPVIPLVVLVFVASVFHLSRRAAPHSGWYSLLNRLPPVLVAIEVAALNWKAPFWKDDTRAEIAMVADVLRATGPGDFVMDATGETMFRMRPYYYALEAFTKVRIERGLITDDIVERLIATRTAVVRPRDLTEVSRSFVHNNYLAVGHGLWMLGKELNHSPGDPRRSVVFDVAIPANYTVLTPVGKEAVGELDGTPLNGPRLLNSGPHTFVANGGEPGRLTLFWAVAFERGFSPLLLR
jgi:hypothetical protein